MGTTDNNNWTRVQQSVREAERLIGQKQYNLAMIKSRQALEFMVNCLGEKACDCRWGSGGQHRPAV